MAQSEPSLSTLQRWMQSVITHPAGVTAGIDSEAARNEIDVAAEEIEQVITRSRALDSIGRLQVYGNAYYARLLDCLSAEFPTLRHAAGEEAFGAFCFGYLQQHPSTTYTLTQLGAKFPQYLAETRPARVSADGQPDWMDFLIEVARLERLYSEVFDGPGEEKLPLLSAERLTAIPRESWPLVRLTTVDSLRLVEFRFPVHEYITSVKKGESPSPPDPAPTRLAINRRDYIVRRRSLPPLPFELLRSLRDGLPLGEAIERAVRHADCDPDDLPAQLRGWFKALTTNGYFLAASLRDHLGDPEC